MRTSRDRPRPLRRWVVALLLAIGVAAPLAGAEDPPPAGPPAPVPLPPRGSPEWREWRETTWAAPTEEDWKKPVLLRFQRTWEDAVAVAREEGRPILVCINMDGEIASEHYAGVRYRQPEIAALYEPYVAVIASVYRHNPRDHDDQGRRILCPRFGSVTCGEHIAIEPVIFEKFCDGQRVAPRHICVELDGSETYDVFYANDTASVFRTIQDGIAKRAPLPPRVVRGDRPVLERVGSRHAQDRAAVEAAYEQGDRELRRSLLEAAQKHGDVAPLDLLRLAIFGFDVDLGRSARQALTRVQSPDATTLVADALRVPMDAEERDALIATLKRLGSASELARWLAVVHQGLARGSAAVDPKGWTEGRAGGATYEPAFAPQEGDLTFHAETRAQEAEANPDDPGVRLDLAEISLTLALHAQASIGSDPRGARLRARHLIGDARRNATQAAALGATGWRANALLALSAYYGGETEEGYRHAIAAMADLPPGDTTWMSMAVLTVFAEARWKAIRKAVKEKVDFPPEWLADVNAAYGVLRKHPLGTEEQVLWHQDLLDWLGAYDQSTRVLLAGLERFGDSPALHERLRGHLLKQKGPAALEAFYAERTSGEGVSPALRSFAARASALAGDVNRRQRRLDEAVAAYGRAVLLYEKVATEGPAARAEADSAIALVLSSRARIAWQRGDDESAVADLVASLERSPESAGTRDGLGITPAETAQTLLTGLREKGRTEQAARLETALSKVDPDLLGPDEE